MYIHQQRQERMRKAKHTTSTQEKKDLQDQGEPSGVQAQTNSKVATTHMPTSMSSLGYCLTVQAQIVQTNYAHTHSLRRSGWYWHRYSYTYKVRRTRQLARMCDTHTHRDVHTIIGVTRREKFRDGH